MPLCLLIAENFGLLLSTATAVLLQSYPKCADSLMSVTAPLKVIDHLDGCNQLLRGCAASRPDSHVESVSIAKTECSPL